MNDQFIDDEEQQESLILRLMTDPDIFTVVMLVSIVVIPLIPGAWMLSLPLSVIFCTVMAMKRSRLPYKLPLFCKRKDYGSPIPGGSGKYRSGEGILYLGNEFETEEEIWISNNDARRHALVLATTGAGKALPDDLLVLSPQGWRRNGDLQVGDQIIHPSGRKINVLSIHPQGLLPIVRLLFADGRSIECSRDHLWSVNLLDVQTNDSETVREGLWTAADIGVAINIGSLQGNQGLRIFVKLTNPTQGDPNSPKLTQKRAKQAAQNGLGSLGFMPSLSDDPEGRFYWLAEIIRLRDCKMSIQSMGNWVELPCKDERDGYLLRQLIWSLGGVAFQINQSGGKRVLFQLFEQEKLSKCISPCPSSLKNFGLEIIGVEGFVSQQESGSLSEISLQEGNSIRWVSRNSDDEHIKEKHMTCIRTDADDGMFVVEGYIPTHNTELLLGMASQSLMWSSGFMFIDGKGTTEFHAKAWSIVSRFGRQDDYRMLNFTDSGVDADASAGGPEIQSNTLNPFSSGSADQLMNLIVSLMGESGNSGDMWKRRAMALVTSTMKALVEMRNAGDILLDVQTIRDFLPLGIGIHHSLVGGKRITKISEVPDAAWDELYNRSGLIELYLRALKGEFSERSHLSLKGFFDTLPGFSLERALNGEAQEGKATEQYGYLSMQLTKPLGSLADDFGHIFRTPIGEVDMEDVVLNRRVLIVLLPALQKAPEEMSNCGRIVISMLKMMMGRVAGSELEGEKTVLIDKRPTSAPSPFIVVLDEAGYYMVKGIDTMMAQARSLGFMIVIAGQDMASMQSISSQIAETAAANARLTVAGATEDAKKTWQFLNQKFAKQRVAVTTGKTSKPGLLNVKWANRPDRQFIETDRIKIGDLQKLREGEFYFLLESKLVKVRSFYIGDCCTPWLAINKFLPIYGPYDPALKSLHSEEKVYLDAVGEIGCRLLDKNKWDIQESNYICDKQDGLLSTVNYTDQLLEQESHQSVPEYSVNDAGFLGVMFGSRHLITQEETTYLDILSKSSVA